MSAVRSVLAAAQTRRMPDSDPAAAENPFIALLSAALAREVPALAGLEQPPAIRQDAGRAPLAEDLLAGMRLHAVLRAGGMGLASMDAAMASLAATGPVGGDGDVDGADGDRAPSPLERLMCTAFLRSVLAALASAAVASGGKAIVPALLRLETSARHADQMRPGAALDLLTVTAGGGRLLLALPGGFLPPLPTAMRAVSPADTAEAGRWTAHMRAVVQAAAMPVEAVLDRFDMTAGEIARLKVGQVLPLAAGKDAPVTLDLAHAGGITSLARGRLGRLRRVKGIRLADVPSAGFLGPLRARLSPA